MIHQIWLMWLGSGVIGGIGLGLGYISPVSTLVKWFPDRRGMATGLAIMGFGGGAMIGAPLADRLMKLFASPGQVGVWQTFLVLAAGYFVFMLCGALGYRVPPAQLEAGRLAGPTAQQAHQRRAGARGCCLADEAVLAAVGGFDAECDCPASGILGMASPLLQEVFGGRLIGVTASFDQLNPAQLSAIAAIAAGFTGLLSLFNIMGRLFWSSLSDQIGRQATYMVFFLIGLTLYASIPWTASDGDLTLFVAFFCIILSMYGWRASPRCRPIWPTCSATRWSAPFTGVC